MDKEEGIPEDEDACGSKEQDTVDKSSEAKTGAKDAEDVNKKIKKEVDDETARDITKRETGDIEKGIDDVKTEFNDEDHLDDFSKTSDEDLMKVIKYLVAVGCDLDKQVSEFCPIHLRCS